jgi:hypothetical protein
MQNSVSDPDPDWFFFTLMNPDPYWNADPDPEARKLNKINK